MQLFPKTLLDKYVTIGEQLVELLVVSLVIFLVGWFLLVPVIQWVLGQTRMNRAVRRAVENLARTTVVLVAIAVGAGVAGLEGALAGSALIVTVLSLAIGFAAQDVLANFISGIFIVQDRRLNVGDTIEWDETVGTIRDIGFRVTHIKTANNESVLVPNNVLATTPITNRTYNDPIGLSRSFGVGLDVDADRMRDIIRRAAAVDERIIDDPAPSVTVDGVVGTSLQFTARIWVQKHHRSERIEIRGQFVQRVNEACLAAGIDLADTSQHALMGEVTVEEKTASV